MARLFITEQEYHEFDQDYAGYCTECQEFTTFGCEPDARNYTCDDCGNDTVHGAQEALLMGFISFK